jgi:salicylate synthetase
MRTEYHELRVNGRFDPLPAAVRLVESGMFETYVLYERNGEVRLAADPVGRLIVDGRHARWSWRGAVRELPSDGQPFRQVRTLLEALPGPQWTVCGYAAFELAYLASGNAGLLAEESRDRPLFDAIVPGTEVRLNGNHMLIRATREARLTEVADVVRRVTTAPAGHAARSGTAAAIATDGQACPVDPDVDAADRAAYELLVAAAVTEIGNGAQEAGTLDKVIISRDVKCPLDVDMTQTYLRGRQRNSPARSFLLRLGPVHALGFSPEIVISVTADRTVRSEPLAGTRAFGAGPAQDRALRHVLLRDPKEVYEHAVSVRAALEDLRLVCEPGSITLDDFMGVRERGSVQHLGSTLGGRLRPALSRWDAFCALFPAITVSGVPRQRAYEMISRLERRPRGLYGGAVFTASADGALDAALVLRALIDEGDGPRLRAGAGIVGSSSPAREYTETCEKLRSVAQHLVSTGRQPSAAASWPDHEAGPAGAGCRNHAISHSNAREGSGVSSLSERGSSPAAHL